MKSLAILYHRKLEKIKGGFWGGFLLVFLICLVASLPLILANTPYSDDWRRIGHPADWTVICGRFLVDAIYIVLSLSHNSLIDLAPLTQFLAITIFAISGVILCLIVQKRVTYIGLIAASLMFVWPYFMRGLSYHFDCFTNALAVLIAVLPFLFHKTKKFWLMLFMSVVLILGLYQTALNITLMLILWSIGTDSLSVIGKCLKLLKNAGVVLAAVIIYFLLLWLVTLGFDLKMQHYFFASTSLSWLDAGVILTLLKRLLGGAQDFVFFWQNSWVGMTAVLLLVSVGASIIWQKKYWRLVLIIGILICSFGILMFVNMFPSAKGTAYLGFGTSLALIALLSLEWSSQIKIMQTLNKIVIIALVISCIIFDNLYGQIFSLARKLQNQLYINIATIIETDYQLTEAVPIIFTYDSHLAIMNGSLLKQQALLKQYPFLMYAGDTLDSFRGVMPNSILLDYETEISDVKMTASSSAYTIEKGYTDQEELVYRVNLLGVSKQFEY